MDLAAFMRGVAAHPVLFEAPEVKLFLTTPDLATCGRWQALTAGLSAPMGGLLGVAQVRLGHGRGRLGGGRLGRGGLRARGLEGAGA